jgi:hypothetical protein
MREVRWLLRVVRFLRGPMTLRRVVRFGSGIVVAILVYAVQDAVRH